MAEQTTKHIVRIAQTDLDGHKPILYALQKIKGLSVMLSNAVCLHTSIERNKKAGDLNQEEINSLNSTLENPPFPAWLFNRRKDPETGEDKHLFSTNIKFVQDNDKKRLAMIKSYKGLRHQVGLPVRGQRTKSNFRRNKGKVQGVKRKSLGKKSGK